MSKPEEKEIIVFNHIPKCGGASLFTLLQEVFPHNFFADFQSCTDPGFLDYMNGFDQVFVFGHLAKGFEHRVGWDRKTRYLTFLREPYSRMVSNFSFNKGMGYDLDFETYVLRDNQSNIMIEYIGEGDLARAKDRLENYYEYFGLIERFADSLGLLSLSLGQTIEEYSYRNKTRSDKPPFDERIYAIFAEKNMADLEFYDFANKLFEKRFNEAFPNGAPKTAKVRKPDGLTEQFMFLDSSEQSVNAHSDSVKSLSKAMQSASKGDVDEGIRIMLDLLDSGRAERAVAQNLIPLALKSKNPKMPAEVAGALEREILKFQCPKDNCMGSYRRELADRIMWLAHRTDDWQRWFDVHRRAYLPSRPLYFHGVRLEDRVPWSRVIGQRKHILVMQSGPLRLLPLFLHLMLSRDVKIFLAMHYRLEYLDHFKDIIGGTYYFNCDLMLFKHERDGAEVETAIGGTKFDSAVIFADFVFDVAHYSQYLKFLKHLRIQDVYVFSPSSAYDESQPVTLHRLPQQTLESHSQEGRA